jgi:hypothetical protein
MLCYEYTGAGVGGNTAGGISKIPSNNASYLLQGLVWMLKLKL